jgi:hypothetical protein
MPTHSRIARRLNAMLLVAALAVVQVCAGFTSVVAYAATTPAATAAGGCCNEDSEPACGSAQDTAGALNITCAPFCIERQDAAKSDSVLPSSESIKHAGLSPVGRVAFPPHSTRLSAAPRAANTTPLIYQFQRLLN